MSTHRTTCAPAKRAASQAAHSPATGNTAAPATSSRTRRSAPTRRLRCYSSCQHKYVHIQRKYRRRQSLTSAPPADSQVAQRLQAARDDCPSMLTSPNLAPAQPPTRVAFTSHPSLTPVATTTSLTMSTQICPPFSLTTPTSSCHARIPMRRRPADPPRLVSRTRAPGSSHLPSAPSSSVLTGPP